MSDEDMFEARLTLGFATLIALAVLYGFWGLYQTYTAVVVGVGKIAGAAAVAAIGLSVAAYALGYVWTDLAPVAYRRLRAWWAYFRGQGGESP